MNGGYVMINCDGLDLTSQSTQTIDGIFEDIDIAYNACKPVFAYNCKWGTLSMSPVPVMVNPDPDTAGNYVVTSSVLQIRVTPSDVVTISVLD